MFKGHIRPLGVIGAVALLAIGSSQAAPPPNYKAGGEGAAASAQATRAGEPAKAASAPNLKSGEQVYKEVCSTCHATGVANAPKFGDKAAWKPLIAEGQHVLTAHAWVGVRGMPPKGGRDDLKLEEFARGAAFMARAAGGTWQDPDARMLVRIADEEKKRRAAGNKAK